MTRTEFCDSPCSILMRSKRRTQLHTFGRDVEETRLGTTEKAACRRISLAASPEADSRSRRRPA
ncbi:MAG: hypothetical protein MZV64_23445 [Ignavibacteriales bacterium]|nr:hypothetical protein [Ignavibacteriales bacterium]